MGATRVSANWALCSAQNDCPRWSSLFYCEFNDDAYWSVILVDFIALSYSGHSLVLFFLFFTFFIDHVDSIVVHYILKRCRYRGVSVLVSTLVNWCNTSNNSNNITCYQPRSSFVPVPRDIKGHRSVRDAVITALFPRWRVTNGTVVGGTACVLNVHWSLRDNGLWLPR